MKKENKTINFSVIIFVVLMFSFFAIIIKLSYVSLNKTTDGIDLTAFVDNRNTEKEILKASRGSILSADGELLAQSVNSYTVIAYLSETRTKDMSNPQHVVNKEETAEKLSGILGMSKEYILKLLNKEVYQVELGPNGRNISTKLKKQIEALGLPGIDFIESSKRFYPLSSTASYIIGFAQRNDNDEIVGHMGIEAYYDNELQGTDGYTIYQKDAYGYSMPNTTTITEPAIPGQDIYLTIDSKIQLFVDKGIQEIVKKDDLDWITISVLDAKTGAVVASGSNHNFNLNTLEIDSYLNPLTSYTYEPGSTMKIFSFLAAMEKGMYKGSEKYESGSIIVDDATIKDFNKKGWGIITYDEGFAYSSNVAATNLALRVGREDLYNFYNSLGFGSKTNITLPAEETGSINFKYKTELATASFGQGRITTTPIQNLQALTILANDGVELQPYIVEKIVNSATGEVTFQHERTELGQKIKAENAKKMLSLMYDVVYSGKTDAKFFKSDNITLVGKTGTAQIPGKNGYLTGKNDYIRSFAGVFPYEDPKYIIYMSVKQYQGNFKDVAEIVTKIVEEIAKNKNINELIERVDNDKIITINNYISSETSVTEEKLKALNIQVVTLGSGKYIINQYPEKGSIIMSGNKMFLLTNEPSNYTMPDISGWSRNEVETLCKLLKINLKITGYGRVVTSSIEKGTQITEETILEITLE